jgi:hypothetical protein
MRKFTQIILVLVCFAISKVSFGLTVERDLTPYYVSHHSEEFSIKVDKGENGLIKFVLKHHVPRPMYHVAHLTIVAHGKKLAETSTPVFGKIHDNTFYFSIARDLLAESTFDLSDSAIAGTGEEATPVVGTTIYRIRPIDFVPKKLLDSIGK